MAEKIIQKVKGSFTLKMPKDTRPLMRQAANTAKNHFLEGFRKGGYMTDASSGGWKPRKQQYHYVKWGEKWKKRSDEGKAILVQSGTLRRSIQVLNVRNRTAKIGTRGVRYAAIHNFGLMGKAWGKYPFKMPKREFIGKSEKLNRKLKKLISDYMKPKTK